MRRRRITVVLESLGGDVLRQMWTPVQRIVEQCDFCVIGVDSSTSCVLGVGYAREYGGMLLQGGGARNNGADRAWLSDPHYYSAFKV